MAPGQEADGDNLGKSFRSSSQKWYFSVLIRITSLRQFYLHKTYNFMIKYQENFPKYFIS